MKAGAKTSEFILTVAGFLTAVLNKKLNLEIPDDVFPWLLGMIATYAGARTGLKWLGNGKATTTETK